MSVSRPEPQCSILSAMAKDKDAPAADIRKRPKTATTSSGNNVDLCTGQTTRRSARSNLGKGGQKVQLENIEHLQVQRSKKVSKLVAATSNEPLNPMAPEANGASSHRLLLTPSSTQVLVNQLFQLIKHQWRARTMALVSLDVKAFSFMYSGPVLSAFTAPQARYGYVAPISRTGSVAPTSHTGSVAPASRDGSTPPTSRAGSTVSTSHAILPVSRSISNPCSTPGKLIPLQLPLRSSQVAQQTHVPFTQTYSAHSLEDMAHQMHTGLDNSRPHSHINVARDDDGAQGPPGDLAIDEVSPNEDEQIAEKALWGTNPALARHSYHFDNSDIDPTLLAKDHNDVTRDLPVPADNFDNTCMDLLAQERANNDIAHNVISEHHQCNRFPWPPDPSSLRDVHLQQQTSAFSNGSRSRGSGESSSIASRVQQPKQNSAFGNKSHFRGSGDSSSITSRVQQPEQKSTVGSQSRSRGSGDSSSIASHVQQPKQNSAVSGQSHPNGSGESSTVPSCLQQQNSTAGNQSRSAGIGQSSSVPSQAPSSSDPLGPLTGSPTKLRAYPHKFREVIKHAKQIAQCQCALIDPFPNCSDFIDRKSGEHFTEAIAECHRVLTGYWPQYKKDLGILALMTWHSTLKAKARELILRFYAPSEDLTLETNKMNAELLIRQSAFTRDGIDEEGSMTNMAAPTLAALVVSFFYTSLSALQVLFPKVFGHEVPEVTICLAATALRAAINEYVDAGYSKIYASFYTMQLAINKDPKHLVKTRALRVGWAASATALMDKSSTVVAFNTNFQPILD
ncbi:hypothetical protein OG21DRAFT_1491437 [Imleria badia]|nr:hypothetical protein OG21DRAFT_1491437 [Imleria badia]